MKRVAAGCEFSGGCSCTLFSQHVCYSSAISSLYSAGKHVNWCVFMSNWVCCYLSCVFWYEQCTVCIAPLLCFALIPLPSTCVWVSYTVRCKEIKNCMCCSSWLQYRICHSLSTIQYVLVPQVQRQLQAALRRAAGSRAQRHRSGSRSSRSSVELRRGGRSHQAEGSPQDQLGDRQRQDRRETHTCQGKTEETTPSEQGVKTFLV